MECNIPVPNPAITSILLSDEMRSLVRQPAEVLLGLYRQRVAKDTGDLARSARVEVFLGGRDQDRWCSRVIATAPYAAFHEATAHELNQALNALGAL